MTTTAFKAELNKAQRIINTLKRMCDDTPVVRNHATVDDATRADHAKIVREVALEFEVTPNRIMEHNRTEPTLTARFTAVYIFHNKHKPTLAATGDLFNRDHGTILYALRSMQNRLDTEPAFKARVEKLKGMLK